MKRNIFWSMILLLVAAFSACTNESDELIAQNKKVVLNAGIDNHANSRVVLGDDTGTSAPIYWSDDESDAFSIDINETSYTFQKQGETTNAANAKFVYSGSVELPTLSAGTTYTAKYPATTISSYASQTGTKESLKDYHYMEATFTATEGMSWNDVPSLTFDTKVAIVKLTLSNEDFKEQKVTGVTLKAEGATVVTATSTFDGDENGCIVVYFAVQPHEMKDITLMATCNKNDYIVSLTDNNLITGKLYRVSKVMTKIPYLTFTYGSNVWRRLNVKLNNNCTLYEKLEYSLNGGTWYKLTSSGVSPAGVKGGTIRLRGKSSKGTAESSTKYIRFATDDPVGCIGDIRTLIDYENYATVSTADARFCHLFNGGKLTSAPELPATQLATSCYAQMFSNCDNLITAPVLPAPALTQECYYGMFQDCDNLQSVTMLATDVPNNCMVNWLYNAGTSVTSPTVYVASKDMVSKVAVPNGWTVEVQTEGNN